MDVEGLGNICVWHDDPNFEAVVNGLIQAYKPDRFVETGTYKAETIRYVAAKYPELPIYSAEIVPDLYSLCLQLCRPYPNIYLYNMDSVSFLRQIREELSDGLSMFWLDAHWYNPPPLREECKVVASLDKYVALLDDFACNNPRFDGDMLFDDKGNPMAVENNINYVKDILGVNYFRPSYRSLLPYHKGYALFLKGVPEPDSPHLKAGEAYDKIERGDW